MKTSRILLLAGLLAGTASLLSAGPGPQFWNRSAAPQPAPAAVSATTINQTAPMAAVCSNCACCKKA